MCKWEQNLDRKLHKELIGMSLGQNKPDRKTTNR